jgi:AraC-like DNA-binding protein
VAEKAAEYVMANQKMDPETRDIIRNAFQAVGPKKADKKAFCEKWADEYDCTAKHIARLLSDVTRANPKRAPAERSIWDMPRPVLNWVRK